MFGILLLKITSLENVFYYKQYKLEAVENQAFSIAFSAENEIPAKKKKK